MSNARLGRVPSGPIAFSETYVLAMRLPCDSIFVQAKSRIHSLFCQNDNRFHLCVYKREGKGFFYDFWLDMFWCALRLHTNILMFSVYLVQVNSNRSSSKTHNATQCNVCVRLFSDSKLVAITELYSILNDNFCWLFCFPPKCVSQSRRIRMWTARAHS